MFLKQSIPYTKLNPFNDFLRQRKFLDAGAFAWIIGMLFMCIIIMSLMIVKVSSTAAYYQNQTSALRTRSIQSYEPRILDSPSPTEGGAQAGAEAVAAEAAAAAAVYEQRQLEYLAQTKPQPLKPPKHRQVRPTSIMSANSLQEPARPLQYFHHQRQHLQQQQQRQQLHAIASETDYLLERAGSTAHEQPIYGTWRTKARRPQSSLVAMAPATGGINAAALTSDGDDHNDVDNNEYQHHLYERLPRRASTMTPSRSELRDQIPRPPRLTSRRPSMIVRRQYAETPMNVSFRDDQKPKPFHFPHEGPLPEEFKKAEAERNEVNNIQDILQQLHLGGAGGAAKMAPMMMMPTGLHIAGSFKNLKSSGITNFFRNKRNKKQMQLSFPMPMSMPMHLFNGYQQPLFNALQAQQPYQRIAMDQFYPFKPRSPNDINLLAMHQQFQANRSKGKKKHQQKNIVANNLMLQQHSQQRPFATDPYWHNYSQLLALNATTQKPKLKRVPFKVNLDIYPVMPPTKDFKGSSFTLEEAKMPSFSRPPSVLRHPSFSEYFAFPYHPSTTTLPFTNQFEQPVFSPLKFPTTPQPAMLVPQSSNTHVIFPDQMPRYEFAPPHQQHPHHYQQQQQQPPHKPQYIVPAPNQQSSFAPAELGPSAGASTSHAHAQYSHNHNSNNNKSNQIMVHLNVFPKPSKPAPAAPPSTNPFYNNNAHYVNRNTIFEESDPLAAIEPRAQSSSSAASPHEAANFTNTRQQQQQQQQQPIARNDNVDLQPLVDFEHPIVAAEIPELPQPSALISNKLDTTSDISPQYDHIEARTNFNFDPNANVEQLASEAQAASLFRFPVEDLIQFQVDDAL